MKNQISFAIQFGLCSLLAAALHAQTTAKISGSVIDQDANPVAGAAIEAQGQATKVNRQLKADEKGVFLLNELPPGSYQINATCGTCNDVSSIVVIGAGQSRTIVMKLNSNSSSTEIAVDKTATTIESTSARVGYNATAQEIASLPVNGRTYAPLTLGAPFVSNSADASPISLRISGQSNQQTRYRLDGIDVSSVVSASPVFVPAQGVEFRLRTSVESVQEFRVDSAMTLAEDGFAGGGQVKLVSRAGQSQWHGALFEYFRNDALDARNFFDAEKPNELRMNQFGANAGGMLLKDKLFAFGSFEKLKQVAGIIILQSAPSIAARNLGSALGASLFGNVPLGLATPDPDLNRVSRDAQSSIDEFNLNFRLDYLLNMKNRFFARYSRTQGSEFAPDQTVAPRNIAASTRPDQTVFNWTSDLSGNLINQFTAGLNRAPTNLSIDGGSTLLNRSYIISGNSSNTVAAPGGLIQLIGGGYAQGAQYQGRTWNFLENLVWAHGAHSVKAGLEFRRILMPFKTDGGTVYHYLGFDDALLNSDADITYYPDQPYRAAQSGQYAAYVQDEWRLLPNLTVDLGLRYEYFSAPSEQQNRGSYFNLSTETFQPLHGGFYPASRTGFAPRLAAAWSPRSMKGKTVLRAGAGLYQGPISLLDSVQPIRNGAVPSFVRGGVFPLTQDALAQGVSLPYGLDASSLAHMQRNFEFSASLQQALPAQMVGQIAYLGILSRHLPQQGTENLVTGIDPVTGNAIRANPGFGAIQYLTSGANSSYQALQLGLSRRLVNGPTLSASYNLAHTIGDSLGTGETEAAQNPTCLACERSSNNFDVRHTVSFNGVYDLPFGQGRKYFRRGLLARVTDRWSLAGAWNFHSGLPVNVTMDRSDEIYAFNGAYYSALGDEPAGSVAVTNVPYGGEDRGAERPNLVPGVNPYINRSGTLYLNPAAFSIPQPGTLGNLGRNALRGPGFSQIDLQVTKTFQLGERQKFIFRMEAFNLTNHTNFANPSSLLPDVSTDIKPGTAYTQMLAPNFGQLTSTVGRTVGLGTPRQLQLSLRYQF